jgi:hypothetical protein
LFFRHQVLSSIYRCLLLPIIEVHALCAVDRQVTRSIILWSLIVLVLGIRTVTLDFSYCGIQYSLISWLKSVAKYAFMYYSTLLKLIIIIIIIIAVVVSVLC